MERKSSKEAPLPKEWMKLVNIAKHSTVSKEQFADFLEKKRKEMGKEDERG